MSLGTFEVEIPAESARLAPTVYRPSRLATLLARGASPEPAESTARPGASAPASTAA